MGFGEIVRKARVKAGWSMRKLGKRCGVTGAAVCGVEKGTWEPGADLAGRLCSELGIQEDPWVAAVMAGRIPKRVTRSEAVAVVTVLRQEGKAAVDAIRELSLGAFDD